MRDDRDSGDITPLAVWFAYTPDRKGIHPQQYLESFNGTLQANASAGEIRTLRSVGTGGG